MAWVHTWFGLVLGFVLMAAFFFGTLSVFDREIDRWSIPESRFDPQPIPSFDKVLLPVFQSMDPGKHAGINYWQAFTTHRDPVLTLYAGYEVPDAKNPDELIYAGRTIDPRTGTTLPDDRLAIGSGFFFPLHFNLTV